MQNRHSVVVLVLLVTLLLLGCQHSAMDRLDREVTRMLREYQFETLGPEAPIDPDPVPRRERAGRLTDEDYAHQPTTVNPSSDELIVRAEQEAATPGAGVGYGTAETGEPLEFDINDALGYAIAHSREYRDRKEDLFLAAIDLLAEQHLWGPRFFNDTSALVTGTPESGDHDHVASLINDLRLTQRLPYGGDVTVGALISFVDEIRNESRAPTTTTQSTEVRASVTLPLLRGAGKVAREDLIQSHRNLVYAARDFERFRRQFLVSIATDYFGLLQRQAGIRNQELQLRNLQQLSRMIAALAESGREAPFEVQRSRQQELFARNNLLRAQEAYAVALDRFKIRLGMPTTQKLTIAPFDIEVPVPELNETKAVRAAWTYRLDYQTSYDLIGDAQRRVEVARNNQLADLDVTASVSLPTDLDKRRGGLDFDAGAGQYSIGVTYGAPLDRRIEQLGHRRALVNLERAKRNHGLFRDQIALDVRESLREIELARTSLSIQRQNLELAVRRQEGVQLRLRTLGPRDFIEAQEDLLGARDDLDAAVRDLRVSVLNFLLNTGQMRVGPDGRWRPPNGLMIEPPQPQPQPQLNDAGPGGEAERVGANVTRADNG